MAHATLLGLPRELLDSIISLFCLHCHPEKAPRGWGIHLYSMKHHAEAGSLQSTLFNLALVCSALNNVATPFLYHCPQPLMRDIPRWEDKTVMDQAPQTGQLSRLVFTLVKKPQLGLQIKELHMMQNYWDFGVIGEWGSPDWITMSDIVDKNPLHFEGVEVDRDRLWPYPGTFESTPPSTLDEAYTYHFSQEAVLLALILSHTHNLMTLNVQIHSGERLLVREGTELPHLQNLTQHSRSRYPMDDENTIGCVGTLVDLAPRLARLEIARTGYPQLLTGSLDIHHNSLKEIFLEGCHIPPRVVRTLITYNMPAITSLGFHNCVIYDDDGGESFEALLPKSKTLEHLEVTYSQGDRVSPIAGIQVLRRHSIAPLAEMTALRTLKIVADIAGDVDNGTIDFYTGFLPRSLHRFQFGCASWAWPLHPDPMKHLARSAASEFPLLKLFHLHLLEPPAEWIQDLKKVFDEKGVECRISTTQ